MTFKIIGNIQNIPIPDKSEFETVKELKRDNVPSWEDFYKQGKELIENDQVITSKSSIPKACPILYSSVDETICKRLSELLHLNKISGRYQLLEPEKMVMVHSDVYSVKNKDSELIMTSLVGRKFIKDSDQIINKLARLMIMLDDHVFGQGIIYENKSLLYWKKGDVVLVNENDELHFTFNASYWDRCMLRISGIKTKDFYRLTTSFFNLSF